MANDWGHGKRFSLCLFALFALRSSPATFGFDSPSGDQTCTMCGKPSYATVSAGKGAKGGKERQGSTSDKSQVGLKQQAGQVSTPSAARGINWDKEEDEED